MHIGIDMALEKRMEGEERQVKGQGGWDELTAAFQHVNNQLRKKKKKNSIQAAAGYTETQPFQSVKSATNGLLIQSTPTMITPWW